MKTLGAGSTPFGQRCENWDMWRVKLSSSSRDTRTGRPKDSQDSGRSSSDTRSIFYSLPVEQSSMPGSLPTRYPSSSWRIPTQLAPVWWPAWPVLWTRHGAVGRSRRTGRQAARSPQGDRPFCISRRLPLQSGWSRCIGPAGSRPGRSASIGRDAPRRGSQRTRNSRCRACISSNGNGSPGRPPRSRESDAFSSPSTHCRARGQGSTADRLLTEAVGRRWLSDLLRSESRRPLSTCGDVRRQDPQGRQARRSPRRTADEVRAGRKP